MIMFRDVKILNKQGEDLSESIQSIYKNETKL